MAKIQKDRTKPGPSDTSDAKKKAGEINVKLGGILGKFGDMIEKLSELAETGENFCKTGEIKGLDPIGKLRGVYGVSVKMGLGEHGEKELKVEPFGNMHKKPAGETVVEDVREPLADVHEEEDHVMVLAEIPGVSKDDVVLALKGAHLTIDAERGEKHFHKEVDLPAKFTRDKMRWICKNGILRIRLER
ncbi:MAG: Hsp20/alpha crystallin family protein [Pirellulales bacterium]